MSGRESVCKRFEAGSGQAGIVPRARINLVALSLASLVLSAAFADGASPVITSPTGSFQAMAGQFVVYQVTASNIPQTFEIFAGNDTQLLPPGLTLITTRGIVYGNPSATGAKTPQFRALNNDGPSTPKSVGLPVSSIGAGPRIVSNTCATGRTGQPFSFQVLTDGATLSAVFSATGLPPGLDINQNTGVIFGNQNFDGNFIISLTLTDGSLTATANLQLTFVSDPTFPIITNASGSGGSDNVAAIPGQLFSYTVTADANAHFDVVPGTLPAGLSISSQTPTTATISGVYIGPHATSPGAVKKEPPCAIIQPMANDATHSTSANTGTSPLNLFEPALAAFGTSPNGHVTLKFVGVPNKAHDLESTSDFATWTLVTTLAADANGHLPDFEDSTPGVFYRLRYPSAANANPAVQRFHRADDASNTGSRR
jgi:hypothetical protein